MILYFSGTGNSRYIAEVINSVIEDKLVSINECLKNNLIVSLEPVSYTHLRAHET